jgi:hypothetical protein
MKSKNLISLYLSLVLVLLFPGCISSAKHEKLSEINKTPATHAHTDRQSPFLTLTTPRVTIWIHGTHFWFNKMFPSLTAQEEGVYLASDLPEKYMYRNLIVNKLCKFGPEQFQHEHFYILSWSGVLSSKCRLEAARILLRDLRKISTQYEKKYGTKPEICLITHSHGGNVALNLAIVNDPADPLIINKLVMLAVPVQIETKDYVKAPCFKKTYSLYSSYDMIQIGDMQKLAYHSDDPRRKDVPLFSQRTFDPYGNLLQVKVRFDGFGPFHISFILSKFVHALPQILTTLDSVQLPYQNSEPLILHLKRNKIPILFSET